MAARCGSAAEAGFREEGCKKHEPDELFEELARMQGVEPDVEWERRLLARCHAEMDRRAGRRAAVAMGRIHDLAAAALAGYLAAVLGEVRKLMH